MTVEELVALITPEARSIIVANTFSFALLILLLWLGKVPADAKTKLLEGIREALRDDK